MTINGQKFEPLFLSLYEQHFVKRIFMAYWSLKRPGRVTRCHRQEDDVLLLKRVENNTRVKQTFSYTRSVQALEF